MYLLNYLNLTLSSLLILIIKVKDKLNFLFYIIYIRYINIYLFQKIIEGNLKNRFKKLDFKYCQRSINNYIIFKKIINSLFHHF